jgi:hypothetical protein
MAAELTSGKWPDDYGTTVRRLNARWNLGLPETLALDRTIDLDNAHRSMQRDCARGIYYLSRLPGYRLAGLLQDFAQSAEASASRWVAKPSQEKGTLPVSSHSDSTTRYIAHRCSRICLFPRALWREREATALNRYLRKARST